MRKSRYQLQKERRAARMAREEEKDTIYFLDFTSKDGQPTGRTNLLNDLWCVRLPRNPKDDTKVIEDAVRVFEERHKVSSWREVATSYKVNSIWYP